MQQEVRKWALVLALAISVSACGGRTANPVLSQQYGDENKSCGALVAEMSQIQAEVARLAPETDKTGKNVALGVAGAFFLVPFFFMDLGHAEQIEVEAYRQRYNHLSIIAKEKQCDTAQASLPSGTAKQAEPAPAAAFPGGK